MSALLLFAAEEEGEFHDEDDDDGKFEDEAASLIELVDHEAVEFAGGAQFLIDQAAVIGNPNFGGDQVVEAGVKHIAEKFDGVVHFFGEFHDIEANGIYASGFAGKAPVAEAAAFVFEKTIDTVKDAGEQAIVVAKFEQLGVGILQQLNGGGSDFAAAVDQSAGPADDEKIGLRIGNAGLQNFLAFSIGKRDGFTAHELRDVLSVGGEKVRGGERPFRSGGEDRVEIDDVIVLGKPGIIGLLQSGPSALERLAQPSGGARFEFG